MPLIQIIDDDVTLLASLGLQLEDEGFRVVKHSDLSHAEQAYAEERPDLVLLDVRSEGGRGWDLLARMADATPVIVLSAAAREEDVVRGFTAGAADYVAKPYRSAELLARLRARLTAPVFAAAPPAPPAAPQADAAERLAEPPPRRSNGRRGDNEEAVFMSEAEEMALLRIPDPQTRQQAEQAEAQDTSQGLGQRLRRERMRRHLTLVQVENELKIRMSYLQALEDEKYTLLPRGPAAMQMVQSYVNFLGMDPEPVLAEFRDQHYVDQYEPLPALGGSRLPRNLPTWVFLLAAVLLALAVAIGVILYLDPSFFQNAWAAILQLIPQAPAAP